MNRTSEAKQPKKQGAHTEGAGAQVSHTRNLVLMAMFVCIITISSWIAIPIEISFTMQTFAIF